MNKDNTMNIILDGSALDRLFPEGSEARLSLVAATVNNFVDKIGIKKLEAMPAQVLHSVEWSLKRAQEEASATLDRELAGKDLLRRRTWGTVELSDKAKKLIADQAESHFRAEVHRKLNEQLEATDIAAIMKAHVEQKVRIGLRAELKLLVEEVMKAKFSG